MGKTSLTTYGYQKSSLLFLANALLFSMFTCLVNLTKLYESNTPIHRLTVQRVRLVKVHTLIVHTCGVDAQANTQNCTVCPSCVAQPGQPPAWHGLGLQNSPQNETEGVAPERKTLRSEVCSDIFRIEIPHHSNSASDATLRICLSG